METRDQNGTVAGVLFDEHLEWAASIGRKVLRSLPPSFDIDDLVQTAHIEHWRRVQLFDPSVGVPYRAYAGRAIFGAVQMACRRRHYREATHEEMSDRHVDAQLTPEARLLAREERRNVTGPAEYRRRMKLHAALAQLKPEDADLVRRVLSGSDIEDLERAEPGSRRRFRAALRELKLLVAQHVERSAIAEKSGPMAAVPTETIRAAFPSLPASDAYLVRRVHLEGASIAELAATWGIDIEVLEARVRDAVAALQLAA